MDKAEIERKIEERTRYLDDVLLLDEFESSIRKPWFDRTVAEDIAAEHLRRMVLARMAKPFAG